MKRLVDLWTWKEQKGVVRKVLFGWNHTTRGDAQRWVRASPTRKTLVLDRWFLVEFGQKALLAFINSACKVDRWLIYSLEISLSAPLGHFVECKNVEDSCAHKGPVKQDCLVFFLILLIIVKRIKRLTNKLNVNRHMVPVLFYCDYRNKIPLGLQVGFFFFFFF